MTQPIQGLKNSVSVRFRNSKTGKWVDIEAKEYKITYDSMKVLFNNYRFGQLSFQGKFIHLKAIEEHVDNFDFVSSFTYKGQTKPIKFSVSDGD